MSATGLGVTFWQTAIPALLTPPGLMYLAERDYTITHVFMCNISQTTAADVELGITLSGVAMFTDDSRKFLKLSLPAGQTFDLGSRIPLRAAYGLVGSSTISYGDQMVWCGITGEVSD